MLLHYEVMNRKGAKVPGTIFRSYGARAKGFFVGFVVAIEMQAPGFLLRTILRRKLGAGQRSRLQREYPIFGTLSNEWKALVHQILFMLFH